MSLNVIEINPELELAESDDESNEREFSNMAQQYQYQPEMRKFCPQGQVLLKRTRYMTLLLT